MSWLESLPLLARGEEGFFVLLVLAVLGVGITIRLMAGMFDRERIYQYIAARGGKVHSIHWSPFGRGWFGDKHNRIYEVEYDSADGKRHAATCKTSFWSGVYWTEDQAVSAPSLSQAPFKAPPIQFIDPGQLAQENQRLHAEVQRLKHELKQRA